MSSLCIFSYPHKKAIAFYYLLHTAILFPKLFRTVPLPHGLHNRVPSSGLEASHIYFSQQRCERGIMPSLQMGKQPQRVILSLGPQGPQGTVFCSPLPTHTLSSLRKVELARESRMGEILADVDSRPFSVACSYSLRQNDSEGI